MTITALPTPPSRTRPSTFAAEGDAFLAALPTFQSEVNATAATMSLDAVSTAEDREACELTAQTANFKGNWSDLTGALTIPSSVLHSGSYWMLVSNLADVTLKEPGVDPEWEIIYIDRSTTGSSKSWSVAVDTTITSERWHNISTTAASVNITLPIVTAALEGGPLYVLSNTGAYKFYVKNSAGVLVGEIEPATTKEIFLLDYATESYYISLKTITSGALLSGTATVIKSQNVSYRTMCLIDTNKVLVVYYDTVGNNLKALVLTISGWGVTVGTEVDIVTGDVGGGTGVEVVKVETNKALVCYIHGSSTKYPKAILISVTGTTPAALGSAVQLSSTINGMYPSNLVELETNKFLVFYTYSGSGVYCKVLTVSGSTITANTEYSQSTVNGLYQCTAYVLSSTSVLFSCVNYDGTTASALRANVLSVSGTAVTFGTWSSQNDLGYTQTPQVSANMMKLEGNRFMCVVDATTSGDQTRSVAEITVSGTTITVTNPKLEYTFPYNTSKNIYHNNLYLGNNKSVAFRVKGGVDQSIVEIYDYSTRTLQTYGETVVTSFVMGIYNSRQFIEIDSETILAIGSVAPNTYLAVMPIKKGLI